jgi:hypothetical protein
MDDDHKLTFSVTCRPVRVIADDPGSYEELFSRHVVFVPEAWVQGERGVAVTIPAPSFLEDLGPRPRPGRPAPEPGASPRTIGCYVYDQWGEPLPHGPDHPFFLRDLLVRKAWHGHGIKVHPLLETISPLRKATLDSYRERVRPKDYGQILAYEDETGVPVVFDGFADLCGLIYLGRDPHLQLRKETKPDEHALKDRILRSCLPKDPLQGEAQRCAMAIVTYGPVEKAKAMARRNAGLRRGNVAPAPVRNESVQTGKDEKGRTTTHLANLVGSTTNKLADTTRIKTVSPVVFDAMLSGLLWRVPVAKKIVDCQDLWTEAERAEAVALHTRLNQRDPRVALRRWREFQHEIRERHRAEADTSSPADVPEHFTIHRGRLQDVCAAWSERRFDLCFADPPWEAEGKAELCKAIGELWMQVGNEHALMCLMRGMAVLDEVVSAMRQVAGLRFVCTGSWRSLLIREGGDTLTYIKHIDAQPLLFYSVGEYDGQLAGNEFEASGRMNEQNHAYGQMSENQNQRDLGATMDLLRIMGIRSSSHVSTPSAARARQGWRRSS